MTLRLLTLSFFVLGLFVKTNAQEASTIRPISTLDKISLQKGEIKDFENQLYRLNTAIEDGDQENAEIIYGILGKLMKKETEGDVSSASELKKEKVDKSDSISPILNLSDKKATSKNIDALKAFLELMKQELELLKDE